MTTATSRKVSHTDGYGEDDLVGDVDGRVGGLAGGVDGRTHDLASGADGQEGGQPRGLRRREMERDITFYCLWTVHSIMDDFSHGLLYCFFHNVSTSL